MRVISSKGSLLIKVFNSKSWFQSKHQFLSESQPICEHLSLKTEVTNISRSVGAVGRWFCPWGVDGVYFAFFLDFSFQMLFYLFFPFLQILFYFFMLLFFRLSFPNSLLVKLNFTDQILFTSWPIGLLYPWRPIKSTFTPHRGKPGPRREESLICKMQFEKNTIHEP